MAEQILIQQLSRADTDTYEVRIQDELSTTTHVVSVDSSYARKITSVDDVSIESLLQASFRFLLAREPKDSILAIFDLSDIERYFPEYGQAMQQEFSAD